MRNVAIFIFDDVEVLDFAGPFEVFNVAGEKTNPSAFNTYTVALGEGPVYARGRLSINPHYTIQNCPQPDILLIPGGDGRHVQMKNPVTLDWVREQATQVEYLLSVCTGAFILAHAGVLDGLQATTHHACFEEFSEAFPHISLIRDQRFVDNGRIITAGGVSAGIDMSLYAVRKMLGDPSWQVTSDEMEWMWHQE